MATYTKTNWVNGTTPANATNMNKIEDALEAVYNMIYPVGSIYLSVNNTNPSTLFGGTWEQLKDRFLLGAGDTYTLGDTGGSATRTLTFNQTAKGTRLVVSSGNEYAVQDYNTGSNASQSHSIMPPYLVVYMWKRTA